LKVDSFWCWEENWVAVTKLELKILTLFSNTVTNTNDVDRVVNIRWLRLQLMLATSVRDKTMK
jgi:hypothetical protein